MRRFLFLALLAYSLLPSSGPARAQVTADQLNRLSLEALTARPSGGGYVAHRAVPRHGYRSWGGSRRGGAIHRRNGFHGRSANARRAPNHHAQATGHYRRGRPAVSAAHRHRAATYHRASRR